MTEFADGGIFAAHPTGTEFIQEKIMPRDLPIGNGKILANFDGNYNLRDLASLPEIPGGRPLSVCPLTWSHATVVMAVVEYLERFCQLSGKNPGEIHCSGRSCDIGLKSCHMWEDLPE